MESSPFLDQLVDWREFEYFVRDLFSQDVALKVEHNVEEAGRSGATRQTDVKFTHSVQGVTYTTLVECKRWKEKVTRDRIDVLVASVEDLQASKGVIFTTTGYEPGAEAYAKAKDIDLFIVRDLTDDEWGAPGRVVTFWMHYYNGHFERLNVQGGLLSLLAEPVKPQLDMTITPEGLLDEKLTLVSNDLQHRGPNLLAVLLSAQRAVVERVTHGVDALIPGGDGARRVIGVPVEMDFSRFPTRSLKVTGGRMDIVKLTGELRVSIHQTHFHMDRGQDIDTALAVEHYMTKQRQVAVRAKAGEQMNVYELADPPAEDSSDVVGPNTLLRIVLKPWVSPSPDDVAIEPGNPVRFELPIDGSNQWQMIVTPRSESANA